MIPRDYTRNGRRMNRRSKKGLGTGTNLVWRRDESPRLKVRIPCGLGKRSRGRYSRWYGKNRLSRDGRGRSLGNQETFIEFGNRKDVREINVLPPLRAKENQQVNQSSFQ
jgi:hypothetical protein